jgi:hypothetical protein
MALHKVPVSVPSFPSSHTVPVVIGAVTGEHAAHLCHQCCTCFATRSPCLQVGQNVVTGVLKLICHLRNHEAIDRVLLKSMVQMLRELHLYEATFLQHFLEDTRQLYRNEGLERTATDTAPDYLAHCEARLSEERVLCAELLAPATHTPLLSVVKSELLVPHYSALLAHGLPAMLEGPRLADLTRLCYLTGARVPLRLLCSLMLPMALLITFRSAENVFYFRSAENALEPISVPCDFL